MRRLRHSILPAVALAMLAACILVDDFGESWNEAKPDECLSKIATSLYYTEFRRNPDDVKIDEVTRGLSRPNDTDYLLLKQSPSDSGGRMYRFQVVNGIFQRLRIVPTMRATFEKNYPNAPVSLKHDTIRFDTLGEKEWELIDNIATQPEYWEIEDQTLYNVLRNPMCRFDDRDLSLSE